MPTFCHDLIEALPDRWREVDILLERATAAEAETNTEFHDVLCRASIILLVAHLEGFVRDCVRAVLKDINFHSSFRESPAHLKRTFCNTFIHGGDIAGPNRASKLIALLEKLETKFEPEPFLFEGRNDDSRNPSPAVIERISKNFGIDKIFAHLYTSRTAVVFGNLPSEVSNLTVELRDHLLANVRSFPYSVDPAAFGLDVAVWAKKGERTLWETFLDDVLKKRHDIAHGSNRSNVSSAAEIKTDKSKIIVLQYAFAILLFHKSTNPAGANAVVHR